MLLLFLCLRWWDLNNLLLAGSLKDSFKFIPHAELMLKGVDSPILFFLLLLLLLLLLSPCEPHFSHHLPGDILDLSLEINLTRQKSLCI
jgi:hypothetical protein